MTIIVWYRNDLRVHDLPALAAAADEADEVVPLFINSQKLQASERSGKNRNAFLRECLADLDDSLGGIGGRLVLRTGNASEVLAEVALQAGASAVYATADTSPYASRRDALVREVLEGAGIEFKLFPGKCAVDDIEAIRTKSGTVHKVFTPFWRAWQTVARRAICDVPDRIVVPELYSEAMPDLDGGCGELSPKRLNGGEREARKRLSAFLEGDIQNYHVAHNDMAADSTSRLSAYLHFGCLSVREIETMLPQGDGPAAWHRQLAWRDFYHYVLLHSPGNVAQEFQERYRTLMWRNENSDFKAWCEGKTGYPVVDAAMRQLRQEGWMHNRARLIVGSFLTKDLWIDWRLGERYFMQMLIDGDVSNNNGNWQWIASVGVDPAPVFRRLYNPSSQQQNYDPEGVYVRRYVPELADVPEKFLAEPWKMTPDEQQTAGCIIGKDYPAPIVDHASARQAALDAFRSA